VRNFFKTEWAKLRVMTFAEKRWYIWEYYKFHIFMIIVGAFFLGTLINSRLNPRPNDYLYIAWLGIPARHAQLTGFVDELTEKIAEDPERQVVVFTDYTFSDNFQVNQALQTRFMAMLQMGQLDMFISTREGIEGMIDVGTEDFSYIRTVDEIMEYLEEINPQMHAALIESDRIIPLTFPTEDGGRELSEIEYLVAISLYGSEFLAQHGFDYRDAYLSVVNSSRRFFAIAQALEVLLDGAL